MGSQEKWKLEIVQTYTRQLIPSIAGLGFRIGASLFPASGIFVAFRDRRYVVTAAHILEHGVGPDTLHVFSAKNPESRQFAKFNSHVVSRRDDVAAFELDKRHAADLASDVIDIESCTSEYAVPGQLAVLMGFPNLLSEQRGSILAAAPFVAFSNVTRRPFEEFVPYIDTERPIEANRDIFLEYDKSRTIESTTRQRIENADPKGLSGAGVFSLTMPSTDRSVVWRPQRMVSGIQSTHSSCERKLRATRIEFVVQMLKDAWDAS